MTILPSVNSLIFFTTFGLNFILSKFILKKFEIKQLNNFNLKYFTTPLWFSLIYLLMLILVLTQNPNSKIFVFSINTLICMSFCYLIEGFKYFNNILKKIKINFYIKFIIIFLLFIFLGYVLLLVILIIGYLENFKKLKKK